MSVGRQASKIEDIERLEKSLTVQNSNSIGRGKQVAFSARTNEQEQNEARLLVIKLHQERKERERMKRLRQRQEQLRLSKVNLEFDSFLGN